MKADYYIVLKNKYGKSIHTVSVAGPLSDARAIAMIYLDSEPYQTIANIHDSGSIRVGKDVARARLKSIIMKKNGKYYDVLAKGWIDRNGNLQKERRIAHPFGL